MINKSFLKIVTLFPYFIFAIYGCSPSKFLADDAHLYQGAAIQLGSPYKIKEKASLEEQLQNVLRPKPNQKLLGLPVGVWARLKKESSDENSFLLNWIDKKYGEKPVLEKDVTIDRNIRLLINRLENNGYFYASIQVDKDYKKRSVRHHYQIELSNPYIISEIAFENGNHTTLNAIVKDALEEKASLIKPGERLQLAVLQNERERIADLVRAQGYYHFQADNMLFQADTLTVDSNRVAKLRLKIKENSPADALIPYRIKRVSVWSNYRLQADSLARQDTVRIDGINFIQSEEIIIPRKLKPYILIKEGMLYNQKDEQRSTSRLAGLNTYRFVNIRYDELETDSLGLLDARIYLSPAKKLNLSAELQTVAKSNNFIGPGLILSYRNRNIFKGGELFSLRSKLAYERQLSGNEFSNLSSYELGLQAELSIPRIWSPIRLQEKFRYSIPRTQMSLSYDFLNRVQLFQLNSFLASFGYEWHVNRNMMHRWNPISINFINVGRTSDQFEEILAANPFLQLSFQQQFIAGLTYSFQYSQLMDENRKGRFFILFNADLAGNSIGAIQQLTNSENQQLLGQPYAQYVKLDIDIRHYRQLGKEQKLVSRLYAGWGQPYGNSSALPYVKQFFAGGPNSIRAFRIRSLGPGNYVGASSDPSNFFDQAGDIKLEANIEYRFPIYSFLKGALFTDAGNIWLQNENPALGGGQFTSNWLNQIAIGSGVGMRLDIDFFVLRLDIATPLRKPIANSFQWQNEWSIGDKNWRQNNLIWNFGIGYPF